MFAAVMTGHSAGAIATIALVGDSAEAVLRQIFTPVAGRPLECMPGRVLLGHIISDGRTIDQVTVACEAPAVAAIHCHGNPLLVQRIMDLLQSEGATLCRADELFHGGLMAKGGSGAIDLEAKLALTSVKTLEGAKLIAYQAEGGLSARAAQWLSCIETGELDRVCNEATDVLGDSSALRPVIEGATVVLVGPPNTGKSTLLNTLAGRAKAMVTDVEGTTRDWVSAEIHVPPLAVTLVDTAGLDAVVAAGSRSGIDRMAQARSIEMLDRADVVFLVLDAGLSSAQLGDDLTQRLADKPVIVVLNKVDLPVRLDAGALPAAFGQAVSVSATLGTGIEDLIGALRRLCNVAEFNFGMAVAFTDRQRRLLERIRDAASPTAVSYTHLTLPTN